MGIARLAPVELAAIDRKHLLSWAVSSLACAVALSVGYSALNSSGDASRALTATVLVTVTLGMLRAGLSR